MTEAGLERTEGLRENWSEAEANDAKAKVYMVKPLIRSMTSSAKVW